MKKPSTQIEYIEFARGYAILTIVCYHLLQRVELPALLQKAIIFGGSGVHLFFLLSGFGLGLSRSRVDVATFYRRRLTKVWLPYAIVLTLSWLAAAALDLFPDGWAAWLAGVFLYQMFFEKWVQSFGGHFWFISAIVQFYLIYPLLVWERDKIGSRRDFVAFALLISVIWWGVVFGLGKGEWRVWNSCCLQFLWEFALGMALADLFLEQKKEVDKDASISGMAKTNWLRGDFWNYDWWKNLLAAVVFTAAMIFMILKMGDIGRIFNDIPALVGYTALSIFIFQVGERLLPPLKNFFVWVGGFSYSLYLVHILVLEIYLRGLAAAGEAVSLANLLPFVGVALAVAWAWEPVSQWLVARFERWLGG